MQMGAQAASQNASPATQAMTPPIGMMDGSFGAGGHGGGPGGVGFGGETGVLRIFNESFGPNIAWLILVALIGGGLVIWLLRRAAPQQGAGWRVVVAGLAADSHCDI